MTLARITHRVFIALAVITTVGYLAVGAFFVLPGVAESSDRWLKNSFIEDYRTQFSEISAAEPGVNQTDLFIELLEQLSKVQKIDQLSAVKRAAFYRSAHGTIQEGRLDLAEDLAERWLAFDSNDINARVHRCRLLFVREDTQTFESCYKGLLQEFPDSFAVAHSIARMHFYNGQLGAAYLVLEPFLVGDEHSLKSIVGEVYETHRIEDHMTPVLLTFWEGVALDFSFNSSSSKHVIELAAISNEGGIYRKDLEDTGEIRIDAMDAGHYLEITARIAKPRILETILHPDARSFLLADLQAMDAHDAIHRLDQQAGAVR